MAAHIHLRVRCKKCTGIVFECNCSAEKKIERWDPTCQTCLDIDKPLHGLWKSVGLTHERI